MKVLYVLLLQQWLKIILIKVNVCILGIILSKYKIIIVMFIKYKLMKIIIINIYIQMNT